MYIIEVTGSFNINGKDYISISGTVLDGVPPDPPEGIIIERPDTTKSQAFLISTEAFEVEGPNIALIVSGVSADSVPVGSRIYSSMVKI